MDEKEREATEKQMRETRDEARKIGLRVAEIKQHTLQQHALGNKQAAITGLNELTTLSQKLVSLAQGAHGKMVNLQKEIDELNRKAEAEVSRVQKGEGK